MYVRKVGCWLFVRARANNLPKTKSPLANAGSRTTHSTIRVREASLPSFRTGRKRSFAPSAQQRFFLYVYYPGKQIFGREGRSPAPDQKI